MEIWPLIAIALALAFLLGGVAAFFAIRTANIAGRREWKAVSKTLPKKGKRAVVRAVCAGKAVDEASLAPAAMVFAGYLIRHRAVSVKLRRTVWAMLATCTVLAIANLALGIRSGLDPFHDLFFFQSPMLLLIVVSTQDRYAKHALIAEELNAPLLSNAKA